MSPRSTKSTPWIGLVLLLCAGCGGSGPAVVGAACTPGVLVCGAAVTGQAGIPVLHCLDGANASYVQVMTCTSSCEHVANDSTQVQCNQGADWASLNSACVSERAMACEVDGADGTQSLAVLTCTGGHWVDSLDCVGGKHCQAVTSAGSTPAVGCE